MRVKYQITKHYFEIKSFTSWTVQNFACVRFIFLVEPETFSFGIANSEKLIIDILECFLVDFVAVPQNGKLKIKLLLRRERHVYVS